MRLMDMHMKRSVDSAPLGHCGLQAQLRKLRPPRGSVATALYVTAAEGHKQQRLLIRRRLPWRGHWLCRWLRAPAGCPLFSPALLVLLLFRLLLLLRRP